MDTIFALSSGAPPAGIAIIRISGPGAGNALAALAGRLPEPRVARLASLRDEAGRLLDRGLVLWFPGSGTATGEDLVELHLHGGRAVVAALEGALARMPRVRRAEAGEFTRRAFVNGRIDLAEAEGLADLLEAETELQRAAALAAADGALSRRVEAWRQRVVELSATVESHLDFADEGDVTSRPAERLDAMLTLLADELGEALRGPSAERLREGFRVALAGPPNSGKSTLFNALVGSEAAIAAPVPGTTRDVLERPIALAGIPFTFVDMAGVHDGANDEIERIGIARAQAEISRADRVLWLGPETRGPAGAWEIEAQCDRPDHPHKVNPRHRLSAISGEGVASLRADLIAAAGELAPKPGHGAISQRQRSLLSDAHQSLSLARDQSDPLILAELLRRARISFDRLVGRAAPEDVLNALFARFCIGK